MKPDDLGPSRGIAISVVAGLAIYAAVIAAVLALMKWWAA
jgi:hypothetical protein